MFMHMIRTLFIALASALLLSACASTPEKEAAAESNVEKLYAEAMRFFGRGDYQTAIGKFGDLQSRYPYGRHAEQAQLNTAYAYYRQEESLAAVTAADHFIKLHPTHPQVDYAYYLKGIAYYQAIQGDEWDVEPARQAYDTFNDLITRFPDSRYATDARRRMDKTVDVMADAELKAVKYYLQRGAYVAAADRSKTILLNFGPRERVHNEALRLLSEAYQGLGLEDLAADTRKAWADNQALVMKP